MNSEGLLARLHLLWPTPAVEVSDRRVLFRDLLLLSIISFLVIFPDLGQTRRLENRESRHAEIIRQMARSGDYVVPSLMGHTYFDKPPVMHVMAALLTKLSGRPSMTIARLPSALAGWIVVLAAYAVGRTLSSRPIALLGSVALLGTPGFTGMARQVRPDMILCASIILSSLALLLGMRQTRASVRLVFFGLAGIAAGVGVLTKGPWGIVFPLMFAGLACVKRPELKLPRFGWLVFLAGMIAAAAIWVVPAYLRDGGAYLKGVITQPDLEVGTQRWDPLHRYLSGGLALTLPLSLFFPVALYDWWRRGRRGYSPYLVFAVLLVAIFCFIPKKRPHYLLPMYPFMALGIAGTILDGRRRTPRIRQGGVMLVAASVVAMPLYFAVLQRFFQPPEDLRFQVAKRFIADTQSGARVYACGIPYLDESLAWIADQRNEVVQVDGAGDAAVGELKSAPPDSYLVTTARELGILQEACPSISFKRIDEAELAANTMVVCHMSGRVGEADGMVREKPAIALP